MSLSDALLLDLGELEAALNERRDEVVNKVSADLQELVDLKVLLEGGKGADDARLKLKAIRHRHFGNEDPKRAAQLKAQDVRVRMKAPADPVGQAPPKIDKPLVRPTVSRVVVQGTIQRELAQLEGRMVSLLVDEGQSQSAPEVCFLADLRAGLVGLQRELPEHDLLLGLVNEHLDGVEATLKDLAAGGIARAKRFFEHDRELLGRLKAMVRTDAKKKSTGQAVVDKLSTSLQKARKALEDGNELAKVTKELEQTLMTIHREIEGMGFVAAKSLLFNALRS